MTRPPEPGFEDPDDAVLWDRLRDLFARTDPVPAAVRDAAYDSLSWRDPDTELLNLVLDSALVAPGAAVRDAGTRIRLLTFGTDALAIEVEVDVDGDRARLTGQLVPPRPARLEIEHRSGPTPAVADELGQFTAAGVHRGPVRLRCELPEGSVPRLLETAWVLL